MITVLIPTLPEDTHAIYIYLALKEKGHNPLLWYTADFPTQQTHTFELDKEDIKWTANGVNFFIENQHIDVVWYRRPRIPILSKKLHVDDVKNSEKENRALFQSFWDIIAPDALWINASDNAKKVNSKVLQLKVAKKLGLNIPKTLISNDPRKIKEFISSNGSDLTIYKTFYPLAWKPNNGLHLTYVKTVTESLLPSDHVLQSTPGIYQKKINKAFELRIMYFGTYPVTAKLLSQEHSQGQLDWRAIPSDELEVEPYQIPDAINQKCRAFMDHFGLLFGCFDFIVTPENEYYFLEMNEQGQFLWIEALNSNIKMLDIFTEFLINKNKNFQYKENENSLSIEYFKSKAEVFQKNAMSSHLNPESW